MQYIIQFSFEHTLYFGGIKYWGGQPMAIRTPTIEKAKRYKTMKAAQAVIDKWTGAGVGMVRAFIIQG